MLFNFTFTHAIYGGPFYFSIPIYVITYYYSYYLTMESIIFSKINKYALFGGNTAVQYRFLIHGSLVTARICS